MGAAGTAGTATYLAARPRTPRELPVPPLPPRGLPAARLVEVPGVGELFVRDTAPDAPPGTPVVVLVHGWLYPADVNWFRCYLPLAAQARVLAVDHRGHGRGLRAPTPFRLVDAADDIVALLRVLGTGPAVLVGYSMGGPIAQLAWQRHPGAVSGLVFAATGATFSDSPRDRWLWCLMGTLQLVLRLVPRQEWERLVDRQVQGARLQVSRMVHAGTPPEVLALLPWILGELQRGSAEDLAEAGRELGRYDARGWIGSVDVPAAVLITACDGLVPPSRQRDLAARLRAPHVAELPLDHDAVIAAPELFVPALLEAVHFVQDRVARQPAPRQVVSPRVM